MQDTYISVGCVVGRVITFRGTIRFEVGRDILSVDANTKKVFLGSCNSYGLSIPESMSQIVLVLPEFWQFNQSSFTTLSEALR